MILNEPNQRSQAMYHVGTRSRRLGNFFTLVSMMLFLDLEHKRKDINANRTLGHGSDLHLAALGKPWKIWKDVRNTSDEAWRVYRVLTNMLLNFKPSEEISLAQLEIDASVVEMESISSEPTQHLNDGLFLQEGMFENPNELDIDWNIWHSLIEEASFDEAFQGIISNHSEFDDDPQYRDTHFPSN